MSMHQAPPMVHCNTDDLFAAHKPQPNNAMINRTQSLDSFGSQYPMPYHMHRLPSFAQQSGFSDELLQLAPSSSASSMALSHPQTPPVYDSPNGDGSDVSPLAMLSATSEHRFGRETMQFTLSDQGRQAGEARNSSTPLGTAAQTMQNHPIAPSSCPAPAARNQSPPAAYYHTASQPSSASSYQRVLGNIDQQLAQYSPTPVSACASESGSMQMMVGQSSMQSPDQYQPAPAQQRQQPPWFSLAADAAPSVAATQQAFSQARSYPAYSTAPQFQTFPEICIKAEQDAAFMLPSARASYLY